MSHQVWLVQYRVRARLVLGYNITSDQEDDNGLRGVGKFSFRLTTNDALQVGAFVVPASTVGCPDLVTIS